MTLAIILGRKGRDVATVAPDMALRDVVKMLSDMKIGAIVVADGDKRVLGIFSERDVIHVVAARDAQAFDHPVSQYMTKNVVTGTGATSVTEAMGQMTENRFRHLPVVEGGRLIGIVSIGDLVKHRLSEMETENQALQNYIAAV